MTSLRQIASYTLICNGTKLLFLHFTSGMTGIEDSIFIEATTNNVGPIQIHISLKSLPQFKRHGSSLLISASG